jgi:glycine cleavage system H protein
MKDSYSIPNNLQYTSKHEWVEIIDGENAIVGITDYAQKLLKEIVYVELPSIGKKATKGESCATVESVKSVSDIYSPITGEIFEINEELENEPELINKEPYEKGWLFKIRIKDKKELDDLMNSEQYEKHIEALSKS